MQTRTALPTGLTTEKSEIPQVMPQQPVPDAGELRIRAWLVERVVTGGANVSADGDWLDRLWECPDLAPAPTVRRERTVGPACASVNPQLFLPQATPLSSPPSDAEREALAMCAGCPVQSACLSRDLARGSTPSGVRGGLRESERHALYVALFGRLAQDGVTR
ncbi:WhiB family transcriptional regulator [Streptomyces sp. NPDC051577]|uniref:WhiB family transcriptional regulator n=1 Tax=Streptomyces sp. NPDC051577 TaxID=3155166 RepID=UPI00343516AE